MTGKGEVIWALGAMSGTSLDGVDAALVLTDGQQISAFGDCRYQPYSPKDRDVIAAEFGKWSGGEAAAEIVETTHAQALAVLAKAADVVGFHGQTVAHDPSDKGTRQIGDGSILASVLDRPVVWDFRSNDVGMGGQGAPLAPFFHHACARWYGAKAPVIFLNLGGVGNLTFVDPGIEAPEAPGACLAFDTGPANAPINDLMITRQGKECDTDGALAAKGTVDADILETAMSHRYFAKMPPKSLDRNDFHDVLDQVGALSDADAAATLTAIAAGSVVQGLSFCPSTPAQILVTGGGRKNPVLMAMLAAGADCPVVPVEEVGLDGDMLEAQAFAYLAVRVLNGLPTSAPSTTGVAAPIGGGKISRPKD